MENEIQKLRERVRELEAERRDTLRVEEQRRELDALIQHLQRMESLSALAGGVAHEFNNLLTGILGNAGLALCDLLPGSAARESLLDIETAAQRAAELAGQILAYAGRGPLVSTRIDLARLAEETVGLMEALPGEGVRVAIDTAADTPPVRGDASQIRQALTNVFSNAVRALGQGGGSIRIRTGAVELPSSAGPAAGTEASKAPGGDYAFAEVIDDGCGMEPMELERAFEPFFSGRFAGRGLGLAATHGIVRGHGGTVELESRPGEGTRVRLLFPAAEEGEVPREEPRAEEIPAGFRGRGLILVVDDDEVVLQVATRVLARQGFSILTARDGVEALSLLGSRDGDLAAVVLDLVMPRMNGAEALLEIRKLRPDLPVIVSTGYSAADAAARLAGLAADGFVQKPYRREQLVAALRRVLTRNT